MVYAPYPHYKPKSVPRKGRAEDAEVVVWSGGGGGDSVFFVLFFVREPVPLTEAMALDSSLAGYSKVVTV